jgi:hypothetical protein
MFLRDMIEQFRRTRDLELLRRILDEHGKRGFALACRAAKMSRGQAKRLLGLRDPAGEIHALAVRACGVRTSFRR